MELKWKIHEWNFKPADYTVSETGETARCIMDVHRGTWVKGVMLRVGQLFNGTGAHIEIGDGDDPDGLMTWSEAAIGSTGLKNGGGAELITQVSEGMGGTNGKLYTEDDTIDLTFTAGSGGSTGLATVYIVYAELE